MKQAVTYIYQAFGFSEEMVRKPLAALVLALLVSDIGGWYLYSRAQEGLKDAQKAHKEDEMTLRKCEAEKLQMSRDAMDAQLKTIKELYEIRALSSEKLREIEAAHSAVKKLKK